MLGHALSIAALALGVRIPLAQDAPAGQDSGIVVTGAKKKYDPDKRVCKSSTPTGSLMRKVICHTAGEWEYQRQRDVAAVKHLMKDEESRTLTRERRQR